MDQKDQFAYQFIKNQIQKQPSQTFWDGEGLKQFNIVLFSDSLEGYMIGLSEYFNSFSDVDCRVVHSLSEWEEKIEKAKFCPDFLLFIGILKDEAGYQAVERARILDDQVIVVLHDFADNLVLDKKEIFLIPEYFEIYLPVKLLQGFLCAKYQERLEYNKRTQEQKDILEQMNLIGRRLLEKQKAIINEMHQQEKKYKQNKKGL